jgi:hypothetical protein
MEVNVSFMPQPLYPQRKKLGTHWMRGRVGPRASLDMVVKIKIFGSAGN